jgi:pyruvate formate lyase activating enzyme
MTAPLLLSAQKFSVHDGPGIRTTVFFKGCPLRCTWCHNPESQNFTAELMVDNEKCTGCATCTNHCPLQAISVLSAHQITDRNLCIGCGKCVDFCLANTREIAGQATSKSELLAEILKDQVFYEQSGGGVTFSGGEAMCHIDTLEPLAMECKIRGLHVAIDTCGYVQQASFERIVPYTDLFLYDLKLMDPTRHLHHTGQDNALILKNLRYLSTVGARINLRLPLIEGINTAPADIAAILDFIKPLRIPQVNLLPYHNTGASKYAKLEIPPAASLLSPPSPERLETIQRQFADAGLEARIGG